MITFGIITDGSNDDRVEIVIDSIVRENPTYQIIVVGPDRDYNIYCGKFRDSWVDVISFDESIKQSWITRKKNLITEHAAYQNIVYMHDYIKLMPGWRAGFERFESENNNWQVQMNQIINFDGTRYRDWASWTEKAMKPYHWSGQSDMYISGAYWVAKRDFMEKYPLDENLCWGQSEDVEWCSRWKDGPEVYFMNQYCKVKLLKQKDKVFPIHD